MADNYLEKKMEDYRNRRDPHLEAKKKLWKNRLDAYRKRMEAEAAASADTEK